MPHRNSLTRVTPPSIASTNRGSGGRLALLVTTLGLLLGSGCQSATLHPNPKGTFGQGRVLAQDPLVERGIDVQHYRLELEILPLDRRIEGLASIRLASTVPALHSILLDLQGLEVWRVEDPSGRMVSFERKGDQLRIDLPISLGAGEETELVVHYGGRPVDGIWFLEGDDSDKSGPKQVWTQGQAGHSSGWFPCFDHPADRATSELIVSVPDHWVTMAPGELISQETQNGLRTDHWRMDLDHPAYLMSLVAGEFLVIEDQWEDIPLYYLAEPHYRDWMEASFSETKAIMTYLSDLTGIRYPYPKYSQTCVTDFPWGGMENVSATTLTPLTLNDVAGNRDQTSHGLVAHELVHQWFGNLLTCANWGELWLNEGFATYLTETYFEQTRGVDEFRGRMRDIQKTAIEANTRSDAQRKRRPIVYAGEADPDDLFTAHPYEGAASRLHLLRHKLGDKTFWQGLRVYLAEYQGQAVTTADFRRTMEKVSGLELGRFFDEWFYAEGEPEVEFSWEWLPKRGIIECSVRQMHQGDSRTPEAFAFPAEIEIRNSRGTTLHRVDILRRRQTFVLPADPEDGDVEYVRFDVNGWVPMTLRSQKSPQEWLAILHLDTDVNGRRTATKALGEAARQARIGNNLSPTEIYIAEIGDRLERDPSRFVRVAAAEALAVAGGVESHERLQRSASGDPDSSVRVAALEALATWGPSAELGAFGRSQFEAGFSWRTMGAAAGLVAKADPKGAYAWITEKLFIDSPHDQLAGYLLTHLGSLENEGVVSQLIRWSRDDSLSPTARAVAVRELAKQTGERGLAAEAIASALDSSSSRLRDAAIGALKQIEGTAAMNALREYYPRAVTRDERKAIQAALKR